MINLLDTTFIIPIYIDSDDRLNNAISVLGFLNKNFTTNVIIHEFIDESSKLDFLHNLSNLNIKHLTEKISDKNYHRTRQLNEMLNLVKTKVVCNYDIDVMLPITSYIIAEKLLADDIFDVIYPYGFGKFQIKVEKNINIGGVILENDRSVFNNDFLLSNIDHEFLNNDRAEYGHCMFFRTDSYKKMGGENENFISYGPEDVERYNRCVRFGLRIYRIKDYVYHLEHSRTEFSNKENPDFEKNNNLFQNLERMNDNEYLQYYKSQEYSKKYDFNIDIIKSNKNSDFYIEHNFYEQNHFASNLNKITNNVVNPSIPSTESSFTYQVISSNNKFCICGEKIDKVRYNFCQKCNKLY